MFFVLPYHVDVPMRCWPWMNWVLIGLTVLVFPFCWADREPSDLGWWLILGHGPGGWLGHMFMHADVGHLVGNMFFLWLFGNAVCAKVGNLAYPFVYLGLGLTAGVIFELITPGPAIGASAAVNGIVGVFVVWYLLNNITCLTSNGDVEVSAYWFVLAWVAFDVWGALRGTGNVGYVAHLAGFFSGFILAVALLKTNVVEMDRGERSLLDVLTAKDE